MNHIRVLFRGVLAVVAVLTVLTAVLPAASAEDAHVYRIDPKQSGFLVNTGVTGLFKKFGKPLTMEVLNYSGTIRFNPQEPNAAAVNIQTKANSVALKTQVCEPDRMNIEMRMHEKVLESEKFPDIQYVSDKVQGWKKGDNSYDVEIQGTLTLHGSSRSLPLHATATLRGNRLEASGEIPLSQKDFGIKSYSYEGGALRVADEVKISFNLVAIH
ncbi:MAG: YceI family protein [Deltaproteobacteria bacterium]|nr:YceI family protein [Deltaproteobacteria bacterium]